MSSVRLQRSRTGQPHSRLVEWFRQLRVPLRRFIAGRRGVAPADLEDVAQEVFLRLLRYDCAEPVADPRRYLFKIAANVASEWSMRARQRLPHAAAWLDDLTDEANVADEVECAQRAKVLHAALASLPPRACEIMRLHFGEGLTHEAIAARMHLSQRIVKRDIVNSCADLRMELSYAREQTVTSPGATVARSAHRP